MTAAIQFGDKQIDFRLKFSNRKSLGITVTPDLNVLVTGPAEASLEKVKEKLWKKAPRVIKQQSFFLSFHHKTPRRTYLSGETHLYLGRLYRFKIKLNRIESVKIKRPFIEIAASDKSR